MDLADPGTKLSVLQNRTFTSKNDRPDVILDFEEAISATKHRVIATPRLRDWFPMKRSRLLPASLLIDIRDWLGHLWLIPFAIRHRRADLILVKGFRTNLLAVTMLGLWPFRRTLLFVIHHNLQFAHVRPLQRTLKLLCRLGVQFALLEADDGLTELGIDKDGRQFVVLPLPVPGGVSRSLEIRHRPLDMPIEIGVIGRDLPEKKTDDLMHHLLRLQEAKRLPGSVLFASDNPRLLEHWGTNGVLTVDTRSYADYLTALARVQVMILSYARDFYFYRSSAVIKDAASLGTAVVCPDYPVFRRQVSEPARVGALFATVEEILPAIHEALDIARSEPGNFKLWAEQRSPAVFSRRIDEFIDRGR